MILFIFEGKKAEPRVYKTLKKIFNFNLNGEEVLHYYCSNIFSLYNTIKNEYGDFDDSIDLVRVLKEEALKHPEVYTNITKIQYSYQVSEIFLFFDYDLNKIDDKNKLSISEQNQKITELFDYFEKKASRERNDVQLYINYPMIESFRYTKILPDNNFKDYTFELTSTVGFKELVNDFSDYKSLTQLCFDINKKSGEIKDNKDIKVIKQNWEHIKNMNIKKANLICTGNYAIPSDKSTISQRKIFEGQMNKYVTPHNQIAILNAFPLFLFEYFK